MEEGGRQTGVTPGCRVKGGEPGLQSAHHDLPSLPPPPSPSTPPGLSHRQLHACGVVVRKVFVVHVEDHVHDKKAQRSSTPLDLILRQVWNGP